MANFHNHKENKPKSYLNIIKSKRKIRKKMEKQLISSQSAGKFKNLTQNLNSKDLKLKIQELA